MRLLLGKSRRGLARSYDSDPTFERFDAWCRAHGLPPLPGLGLGATLQDSRDGGVCEPVALPTPEEFHTTLLQIGERARTRATAREEYDRNVVSLFSTSVRAELDQFDRHCLKLALSSCGFAHHNSVATPGEIQLQIRCDVFTGSNLALSWLNQHAESVSMAPDQKRDLLLGRVHQLWAAAIDEMRHLDEWDSVTEHVWRIPALEDLPGLARRLPWAELTGVERLLIVEHFHTMMASRS